MMEEHPQPSVKTNDIILSRVISIGRSGDAVIKYKGMVVFIKTAPLVEPPQLEAIVNVKITKTYPNFAFGVIHEPANGD